MTLFYQSKANPLLTVDIGFPDMSAMAGVGSTSTVVQYWVLDEGPPRRSGGSRLPADVVRVVISAPVEPSPPSDAAAHTQTATVTRPAMVARLVADVNALHRPTDGVYNCPSGSRPERNTGALLSF